MENEIMMRKNRIDRIDDRRRHSFISGCDGV